MCRQAACLEMADSAQLPLAEWSKGELCEMIRGSNTSYRKLLRGR